MKTEDLEEISRGDVLGKDNPGKENQLAELSQLFGRAGM